MNRLFVNHLTVLDFSYLHHSRGIIGESWILDIELTGELDKQGMVFDFADVKKALKDAAEDLFDHKLVVPDSLPGLTVDKDKANNRIHVSYDMPDGNKIETSSPSDAIIMVALAEVSIEEMEALLGDHLQTVVPANVKAINVILREESIKGAHYQYTHGLKKHSGNCQRITHGHRSKLEIFTDGQRSQLTEYQWAKKWKDIYIASKADIKATEYHNDIAHLRFQYQASQGEFELLLPSASVYIIDTDSTVEWIAEHIAVTLKQQRPQNRFLVRCYEGVKKGAIAEH